MFFFSLHINVSLHFTSAETGGCNPSESSLVFDSLQTKYKSILEFHFSFFVRVTLKQTDGRTRNVSSEEHT